MKKQKNILLDNLDTYSLLRKKKEKIFVLNYNHIQNIIIMIKYEKTH